jgi:hypothetical protein
MSDTELLLKETEGLPPGYMARIKAPEDTGGPDIFDQAAHTLGYKDDVDYLRSNSPKTIAEAIAEAERKFNDPNRKPFSRHYGCLAGDDVYGDGMEYQRKMRDEWPG